MRALFRPPSEQVRCLEFLGRRSAERLRRRRFVHHWGFVVFCDRRTVEFLVLWVSCGLHGWSSNRRGPTTATLCNAARLYNEHYHTSKSQNNSGPICMARVKTYARICTAVHIPKLHDNTHYAESHTHGVIRTMILVWKV